VYVIFQEHFEDVKLREEKAMSEKQQLQQKLKLDRTQWQKHLQLQQQQQEASTAQLHSLLANHAADVSAMRSQAKQQQDAFDVDYTLCDPLSRDCKLRHCGAIHRSAASNKATGDL
jgi:hypothetical protein